MNRERFNRLNGYITWRVEMILNRSNAQALAKDWKEVGGDIRAVGG